MTSAIYLGKNSAMVREAELKKKKKNSQSNKSDNFHFICFSDLLISLSLILDTKLEKKSAKLHLKCQITSFKMKEYISGEAFVIFISVSNLNGGQLIK